ncbi:hypothetical protein AGMMS49949_04430 [Alphaproteobacteria bacterium]|nr:hypothetical protein AGMMS49949_04430 [Alphaproteobacteria bacterium]GHS97638.1 hypothetical protein AGMMS50296_4790 [Alphaproteobacteria bacterium]
MNGKKIIAALGFLGVLGTQFSDASTAVTTPEEGLVKNGLEGMGKFVLLQLMALTGHGENTRTLAATTEKIYFWTKDRGFIRSHDMNKKRCGQQTSPAGEITAKKDFGVLDAICFALEKDISNPDCPAGDKKEKIEEITKLKETKAMSVKYTEYGDLPKAANKVDLRVVLCCEEGDLGLVLSSLTKLGGRAITAPQMRRHLRPWGAIAMIKENMRRVYDFEKDRSDYILASAGNGNRLYVKVVLHAKAGTYNVIPEEFYNSATRRVIKDLVRHDGKQLLRSILLSALKKGEESFVSTLSPDVIKRLDCNWSILNLYSEDLAPSQIGALSLRENSANLSEETKIGDMLQECFNKNNLSEIKRAATLRARVRATDVLLIYFDGLKPPRKLVDPSVSNVTKSANICVTVE